MFLNEVALGNEFSLFRDDGSLKSAPSGYDSVVARGRTEPGERERGRVTLNNNMQNCILCLQH